MKKTTALILALILLCTVHAFAAEAAALDDGLYEVPVTLMHKEDPKESFGNKYIAHTGLLKIENGKKEITILLTTDMKGIEFSYYTDGSLSGEVKKSKAVSGVKVSGESYSQGFVIPLAKENEIGLKFSVPVMPMSPSAKLKIDYGKAVLISAATEQTSLSEATSVLLEQTSAQETESEATTLAAEQSATSEQALAEATAVQPSESNTEEASNSFVPFAILAVAATALIIFSICIVKGKNKK